jgi:hypothetical protein
MMSRLVLVVDASNLLLPNGKHMTPRQVVDALYPNADKSTLCVYIVGSRVSLPPDVVEECQKQGPQWKTQVVQESQVDSIVTIELWKAAQTPPPDDENGARIVLVTGDRDMLPACTKLLTTTKWRLAVASLPHKRSGSYVRLKATREYGQRVELRTIAVS